MWKYIYEEVLIVPDFKREGKRLLMESKLFWKLWFYFGIRKARKRRIAAENRMASMPKVTLEEYWENKRDAQ